MKLSTTTATLLLLAANGVSSYQAFQPRKFGSTRSSSFLPSATRLQQSSAATVDFSELEQKQNQLTLGLQRTKATSAAALNNQIMNAKQQRKRQTTTTLSMLVETSGGMEELQELTEKTGSVLDKRIRKSPSFWKLAGYASIPVSAALGFGLVPSRRLAAHAIGAVVTGVAGAVGKSRLDAITEFNAKPALAQAIIDAGLENPMQTQAAVKTVQEQFGLLDEDFYLMCTEIYSTYLQGMIKYNPIAKTSELKELENLRTALLLENLQVGEAHAMAAAEWYRQVTLVTPEEELEDPDHPDSKAMDKLLFLTERALKQGGETQEAFVFEMTRAAKAVGLSLATAVERVAGVAEPFYQRALQSTRSKLASNQVSSGMLEKARKTLGISDSTAFDMHVACFNAEVRNQLELPEKASQEVGDDEDEEQEAAGDLGKVKFKDGASEKLAKLRDILGLSETDAAYEISSEVTPLYQFTAIKTMEEVVAKMKTPDDAWDVMDNRREELFLKEDSTRTLISSMVMQALGRPLEETNKFAKVNNEAATYDNLLEALETKETLIAILTKSGWEEFDKFDETFCNPWDKQSANGFLTSEDRIKLYRIFVRRSLRKNEGGKISDETYNQILEVKGLLGISDAQAEIEARGAFGPELQKVLQRAVTEIVKDYTPELAENMQKDVDEVMDNYRLTEVFLRETGASFYSKAVSLVSETSPGGIPTNETAVALSSLRNLMKLSIEDTYPAHMENFGTVYKKSILEAMGTTGIIRPEFREPLNDLQDRLGVSEDNCKELFLEAVEEKLVPMASWVGSELERTMLTQQQLAKRRGKDMGEDVFQTGKNAEGVLGLGAEVNIMSDIMNLIDFYKENDVIEEVENTYPPVKEGEEPRTVTEPFYPVTALGSGAIDQEVAELLYRQFVVGGFQAQGEKATRYLSNRATFGGILGLDPSKIEEINSTIGSTVYDNYVSSKRGLLDQQDMMFLANIQTKLDISAEEGEKMMRNAQKKVLSEEINALMDAPTAPGIKLFREKCNAMGVDLAEDVGISKVRFTRMFEAEITPGLKDGSVTAENADILKEIQESLGIEPEECETMFEAVLMRLSKNAIELIKSELLRGREDNTVDLIKEIVRYSAFTGGDLGLNVEESVGYKVLNLYDALDLSEEDPEQVQNNKELLRIAMGLSS